jgi:multicomponent Na+:H+ antiporter subunit G
MSLTHWIGNALLAGGVAFTLIGSLGLLRLPDFYTRAHAAGKPDTMGVVLSVLGLAVLEGGVLTVTGIKLLLTAAFLAVANPVSVHVLSRAALRTGLRPWSRPA